VYLLLPSPHKMLMFKCLLTASRTISSMVSYFMAIFLLSPRFGLLKAFLGHNIILRYTFLRICGFLFVMQRSKGKNVSV
jgi:hypothetical protein